MPPLQVDEPQNDSGSTPPRVQFSNNLLQIHTIENRDDFAPEEVLACWFSAEEQNLMREATTKDVLNIQSGKQPNENTSYRGLEVFYKSNLQKYERTLAACMDAVLNEQERQWLERGEVGRINWRLLRKASLEVSDQCAKVAYKMAIFDEREANKAYVEMPGEHHRRKKDDTQKTKSNNLSKSKSDNVLSMTKAKKNSPKAPRKAKSLRDILISPRSPRKAIGGALSLLKKKPNNSTNPKRSVLPIPNLPLE